MNTDNGALSFESTIDNAKLNKAIEEAAQKIKGFTDTAVKGGEQIDDAFKVTAENISIQKDVIGQLEGNLKALNAEIGKMAPGAAQAQLKKEAAAVTAELEAEKQALTQLEKEVKKNEQAHVSYRTQLRDLRDEMIRMEQAGQRNSDAYRQLQERAGQLADAVGDAQTQMRIMADDQRLFKGIISTVTGMAGAFSAAQGAIGMFSGENENLQKIMLKVQSLMAITIGLQQVSEMLNKDSYFSLVMLTKAKNLFAVANMKVATALGISTVAAKALMATLTLGLSVAITAIVFVINKLVSASAEAKKKMEEFNKAVVDAAAKPLAALNELSVGWSRLGDNMQDKAKFVEQNADKFKELGVNINNVNDAERVFSTEGQEAIKNALIARAKAFAAVEMATEKYRESLKKQLELEKMPEKMNVGTTQYHPVTGRQISQTTRTVDNPARAKIENEIKKIEADGDALFEMSEKFKDQEKELITGLGLSSSNIIEGSLKAVEDSIAKLKEQYRNASNDTDRAELLKQIREHEKIMEQMDVLNKKEKAKENKEDDKALNDFNEARIDALKRLNDEELKLRRAQITDKKALIDFDLEQELKAIDELEKAYKEKAGAAGVINPDVSLFTSMRDTATGQANLGKQSIDKQTYDDLLVQYRDFEQKKQAIIDEFEEKRKIAQANNNAELIARLNEDQAKALSSLASQELTGSDMWTKLFDNLDELTTKEIDTLIKEIEAKFSELSVQFNPIDLQAVRDRLEQAKQVVLQTNPFKAVGAAITAMLKENADGSAKTASQIKKEWTTLAKATEASFQFVDDAIGSAEFLRDAIGQVGSTAISSLTTLAALSISVATAIKTAEKASVILAIIQAALVVVQAVVGVVKSIVASYDQDIDRSIKRHEQAVRRLENAYKELSWAIGKALGSDVYKHQQDAIANLRQQQEYMEKMAKAEQQKKKTDQSKVNEYKEKSKELGRQIRDLMDQISKDLLLTDAKSFADQLGDALVSAFRRGEDAAGAFNNVVNDIVRNIVLNQLKKNFLEKPLQEALKGLENSMGTWSMSNERQAEIEKLQKEIAHLQLMNKKFPGNIYGNKIKELEAKIKAMQDPDQFNFDGLTDEEIEAFKKEVGNAVGPFNEAYKAYLSLFEELDTPSLSGAISKTVTEETATLLSGYINAIRINQIEAVDVQRNALLALNQISSNTAHLVQMRDVVALLKQMNDAWATRSHGL